MKIGPYEVVGEIGRGGMGVVYLAHDIMGREVAVKVLQRFDAEAVRRFEREMRLQDSLGEREGFVPLIDAGDMGGIPYLIMPFLRGGTLRDRLRRGRLSPAETVALGRALASSLGRAHERGIVHRDLKPENVIFAEDGRPLVLDLGLAKHFRHGLAAGSIELSKTGETLGTVNYMSPEQALDSKSVDARTDVFALGAILYECLTGAPAFDGDAAVEIFGKIHHGVFAPVLTRRADAPPWLARVLERAFAREPRRRFANGGELAAALSAGEPAPARRSRAPASALALGGLVALAGVVALVRARPPSAHSGPPPVPTPPRQPPRPEAKPLFESRLLRSTAVLGSSAGRSNAMVEQAVFSPDGRLVATASLDGTVRIWDAGDLHEVRRLAAHSKGADNVAFTPDGKRLLTGGRDEEVRLWDVATGEQLLALPHGGVHGVAVSRDGTRALTGARDGRVGYWNLATGELIRWLAGHAGLVYSVAFATDGKTALSGGDDGLLVHWDLESGRALRVLEKQPFSIAAVSFWPDGTHALAGTKGTAAQLWDLATGTLARTYGEHIAWAVAAECSPDGRRVLTGSFDQTMHVYAAETGALELAIDANDDWVVSAHWSPDGTRVVSGSNDGSARIWDAETGLEVPATPGHRGRVTAIAVAADGRRVLTTGIDRTVRLWDAGSEVACLTGHEVRPTALALSPDGRRALSCGGRESQPFMPELLLWDLATSERRPLAGHALPVRTVAFAPDGLRALSAGCTNEGEGEALLWDLAGEPASSPVRGASAGAFAVSFVDPARVVAGTTRGLELWDLEGGAVESLSGEQSVTTVACAGTTVAGGRPDGAIVVLDLSTRGTVRKLEGHVGQVLALAVARDGKRAVSIGVDATLRLWSLALGEGELDRIDLETRGERALSLAFLPDGRSFLVGTMRGPVLRFAILEK